MKIDYINVLNDIKMKIDYNGEVRWVYGDNNYDFNTNYRIKIEEVISLNNYDI